MKLADDKKRRDRQLKLEEDRKILEESNKYQYFGR
jgi:hypothetical protein